VTAELTFFRRDVPIGPPSASGRRGRSGPGYRPFALQLGGETIPVQVLSVRRGDERLDAARHYPDQDEVDRVCVAFHAPPVPEAGVRHLAPRPFRQRPPHEGLQVGSGYLANRYVAVEVSRTGVLTLSDRIGGERYGGLCLLEDESDEGDAYTFSRGRGRGMRGGRPRRRRVAQPGPLVAAVETVWSLPSAGRGEMGVRLWTVLHADSPVVRLRLDVANQAVDHRLRARFPVGAGEVAMAGAPLGVERREPVPEERRRDERPALAAPAQRFVAAGAGRRGLAIFAPGFFEYEWTPDRDLVVTLLRAVGRLSRADLPERPGHAAWPLSIPEAQELGRHTIELALRAVGEEELEQPERLEQGWEDVFLPIQAVFIRQFSGSERSRRHDRDA
jgi:hypothetical protein